MKIDKTLKDFKSIRGCYVNAGKIISEMEISVLDMTDEELNMYHKILKKVVSGKLGKNSVDVGVYDIEFFRNQFQGSITPFFSKIIENFDTDKNYCILFTQGVWENEESMDPYFILAICPVKDSKAALRYNSDKEFRGISTGSILGGPVIGMLFFASEESVVYYFAKDKHPELIAAFGEAPKSEEEIREDFHKALCKSLGDDAAAGAAMVAAKFAAENSVATTDICDTLRENFSDAKVDEFKATFSDPFLPGLKDTISVETPSLKASVRADSLKTKDGNLIIPIKDIIKLNGCDI